MWEVGAGYIQGTEFMSKDDLKRSDNMKIINSDSWQVIEHKW